jgi:acyl carrier protein
VLSISKGKKGDFKMFEEIKAIIVDVLNCDEDKVVLEASLSEDLDADSLDAVELGMAIEENLGVAISDEDLPNIKTVQDLVDYVEEHK